MGLINLIVIVLVIMWLGGFAINFGGDVIHVLLVLAVIVFLFRFFRRAV